MASNTIRSRYFTQHETATHKRRHTASSTRNDTTYPSARIHRQTRGRHQGDHYRFICRRIIRQFTRDSRLATWQQQQQQQRRTRADQHPRNDEWLMTVVFVYLRKHARTANEIMTLCAAAAARGVVDSIPTAALEADD